MKELSFDQMEALDGSGVGCAYALLGGALAAFGGPLAPVGVVITIGNAQSCGRELDEKFGCIGACSGQTGYPDTKHAQELYRRRQLGAIRPY